ncbi:hypothetical protein [Halalkalicoccus sp. NIPERK01]|uniref:hypothetical protein n=1 Tax=Halalkalicoccus sp. NIPERK01 TaxID=3053469 RepID=UPI00256E9C5E|nr:hypothetical protein [Halalkalicoccus sp. NIPERK01]MDL5363825.1 hypothetical protein [Halalkalicoccus sp. NIPERK01]
MSEPFDGSSRRSRSREKDRVSLQAAIHGVERRLSFSHDVDLPLEEFVAVREPDGRSYSDRLPESRLPGAGEQKVNCGWGLQALHCPSCAGLATAGRACRRFGCPACHESGEFRRARTVASKLESLRQHRAARSDAGVYLHHLVVSLPASVRFNSIRPYERSLTVIKLLLDRINVDAGYIIYHPYVLQSDDESDVGPSSQLKEGWKETRLAIEADDWESVRDDRLVFRPHFHVIGVSEFVKTKAQTKALEDRTGIVIHRIARRRSDGKPRSIAARDELCRILLNELTHVGVRSSEGSDDAVLARLFGQVTNHQAEPAVHGHMTGILRDIAGGILGVDFSEYRCLNCAETGTDSCPCRTTARGDSTGVRSSHGTCNGKLRSLHGAPQLLADPAWRARITAEYGAERITALEEAVEEWNATAGIHPNEYPDD